MKKVITFTAIVLAIILSGVSLILFGIREENMENTPGIDEISDGLYTYFYPNDAVKSLSLYEKNEFLKRCENPTSFEGENNGVDGCTIAFSPYFTATVNGSEIPVYSTIVYVGTSSSAQFHSFATVYKSDENTDFNVSLSLKGFKAENVKILPEKRDVIPVIDGENVNAQLTNYGTYTYIFNDDDQAHAFTFFVKPYIDENRDIDEYKNMYGDDNVIVYEPGIYYVDYINIENDDTVLYLRAGALVLPNHKFEMKTQDDDATVKENGAFENNSLGLARFPVINCYGKNNIQIVGNGTIDMTGLDWHERRGIAFSNCENIKVKGITLVNPADWSLITYCCENVEIDNVTVFGYRTNSDAVVICNTKNAIIKNCFARSGDDLFEVKTLGATDEWSAENIIFENCDAWNGKARCFGVTYEVNKPISNIVFKNCNVLYRDAIWDNDFVSSLAVVVGQGGAKVSGVLFEDIEIYKDTGRPVNVLFYGNEIDGGIIENVAFKNITCNSDMKAQLNAVNGKRISVCFEKIFANSFECTNENVDVWLDNNGAEYNIK